MCKSVQSLYVDKPHLYVDKPHLYVDKPHLNVDKPHLNVDKPHLYIIFGLFHQGGVVPCLLHLQTITHSQTSQATAPLRINIVFSHTYMPPHHLLLISKEENVKVHDLMGQKMDKVCNELKHILRKFDSADELTYLVLPGNVLNEFTQTCGKYIQLNSLHSFFPHLSLDDLSMFENVVDITNFYKFLSLNLFVVKFISDD